MSVIKEPPTSALQARAEGRTYFRASRACPLHNTSYHWAATGQCMSCFPNLPNEEIVGAKERKKFRNEAKKIMPDRVNYL